VHLVKSEQKREGFVAFPKSMAGVLTGTASVERWLNQVAFQEMKKGPTSCTYTIWSAP